MSDTMPVVVTPNVEGETVHSLLADCRVLPAGYRVVITREPSMLMHGKQGEMITIWHGKEMVLRHLRHV